MFEAPFTIDKKLINRVSILYYSYVVNQVLSNSTFALQNRGIYGMFNEILTNLISPFRKHVEYYKFINICLKMTRIFIKIYCHM